MQIDKLAISTKSRTSWQAFDLGCRMALQWYMPLVSFWFMVSLPLFVVFYSLLGSWGLLATWLFKPWYERGLLFIFSRRVFGDNVGAIDALRAWRGQLSHMWFASLTWLRLSPTRGFDMAVVQLEGLTGFKRSQRLNLLHRTKDDNTIWWLIICAHWEAFVAFGGAAILYMLIPPGVDQFMVDILSDWINSVAADVLIYIAWGLIAPFYIGGSFAAYLNRRIQLEGWDIELNFRKMAQRGGATNPRVTVQMICLLILLSGLPVESTFAQQRSDSQATEQQNSQSTEQPSDKPLLDSQQRLEDILDNPPFAQQTTETRFRWLGEQEEPKQQQSSSMPQWLLPLFKFFAGISEFLLWGVFLTALGVLLYLSREHIFALFNLRWQSDRTEPKNGQNFIPAFSYDYSHQDLPEDIDGEVSRLLEQRDYRPLLSLLLISSLMDISRQQALELNKSMTERECLQVIKRTVTGVRGEFMTALIDSWVSLAWGHQAPTHQHLQMLTNQWRELFVAKQAVL